VNDPSSAPSSARERLLQVGARQAEHGGLRSITVRGLCEQAGANPGSFVYHFGSRDAFVAEIIEGWYAPMFERLTASAYGSQRPIERLRALLLQVSDWGARNARFIAHLLADAEAGETAARAFVRTLGGRHPALILQVIRDAQRARELPRGNPLNLMLYLGGTVALPMLLAARLDSTRAVPPEFMQKLDELARERRYRALRLDWALRGLSAEAEASGA